MEKRYKIDVKGWEGFSSHLGTVKFTNGVSDRDLTAKEVAAIGASIRLVEVESGKQVGASVNMLAAEKVTAEVRKPMRKASEVPEEEKEDEGYTREELETLADEKGINGLREVAAEFGVKGIQIKKMINDILKEQSKKDK